MAGDGDAVRPSGAVSAGAGPLVQLDPLEIHSGVTLGRRRSPAPAVPSTPGADPRAVLADMLADALAVQPCHVSFSGGRDSSVILASAVHVARERGLPEPIPLTARYPGHPLTHEVDWQELVVEHLGLERWEILEITDELDALGEIACEALLRYGLYMPSPAHSMIAYARRAGGGTLLTGTGGDEIFEPWPLKRPRPGALVRMRPRRRAAKWAAFSTLPRRVRHELLVRGGRRVTLPWLRPDAQRRLDEAWRASWEYHPTWEHDLRSVVEMRGYELLRTVLETFAGDQGVRLVEPFFDPRFIAAFAAAGPRGGFGTRDRGLEALFGHLLPDRVLRRSTKAAFNEVLGGPRARAFAEAWDGSGVDHDLVDPERLRKAWLAPAPDVRTIPTLQLAWLAAQ